MSPQADSAPLATFVVVAYRQERFIREAIEGALAQTYSPLEIILSDDCSPDSTYAIMEKAAQGYCGPHAVRVNRTENNGGLAAHLNNVLPQTRGKLVVLQAGDDISEPHRTETIVQRWLDRGQPSGSFFSEYLAISETGTPLGVGGGDSFRSDGSWQRLADRDSTIFGSYPGCTHALTRDVYDFFGPLPQGIIQEDICLQLRAAAIGGVGFIQQPLVRYRHASGSQSRYNSASAVEACAAHLRYLLSYQRVFSDFLEYCETAVDRGVIDEGTHQWAKAASRRHIAPTAAEINVLNVTGVRRLARLAVSHIPWWRRLVLLRATLLGRM